VVDSHLHFGTLRCRLGGSVHPIAYRWRDSKTQRSATRTVAGAQFLRLVLQHVLPKGFRRARNFGFLHPNSKRLIAVRKLWVFKQAGGMQNTPAASSTTPRAQWKCACYGAVMVVVHRRILPSGNAPPAQHSEVYTKQ
jgi:hypothetical protein